ncbi:hydrolase or acyltransferase (alpha/beta hydrolase superfamily)-like protein [Streptomyces venezuelae]|uniref:alpha/beta fold hydrolase n=1 Tax=Streptomyces gardneri TaxID=66892 RepID=UPI0006BCC4DF|nr:alpha/beta hydrolase [Streptomyces gardneri]ALO11924.1 hydrolase or acyltransferase (alpha/beta hydrolase superfamily)-like protein [Streptomyces venezuelae]QPK48777.1 alpha/beta hydrolase [Streptomyces gardneri]WRK40257.1 alpha/beta hydrolase [Streptomyces venezuelae]CUM37511.1 Beta-ketoadipate enol-lactone hydrolase [Streptomyces venezuelae]
MTALHTRRVPTDRLTQQITEPTGAPSDGEAVVFVHGNVSSSVFWHSTLTTLPDRYRPLAVDLRGFGGTDPLPVDATRGVRDYADDLGALLDALDIERAHLVGWSMGGGVVLQYLRDNPARVGSLTLVNPVSPYGFGGTREADGTLNSPDGAGSGGGTANDAFVRHLAEGDRGEDSPVSPRTVLAACYVKPPLRFESEDAYVEAMLTTRTGDDHYPGDSTVSTTWPGVAPGTRGVLNCLAPTHFRIDDLHLIEPKPPVLWVRGEDDVIVSDTSMFDLAHLGSIDVVPGWDGTPAQPMIAQTRHVLDQYAAAGGRVREVAVADAGHAVHLERPEEFGKALLEVLSA